MQYDVDTPEAYLEALADDWRRERLLEIRALIEAHAPELDEAIAYKMLSYRDDDGMVFALNAQKNYVSLYVGDVGKVDAERELLEGLDHGKGCIRFKRKDAVADTAIDAFIARVAALRREGADIGC